MNADEIMRALKSNAEVNPHAAVMMMAADLIENPASPTCRPPGAGHKTHETTVPLKCGRYASAQTGPAMGAGGRSANVNHKVVRVDNLMYKGCEPHWRCVHCGKCVPFHCCSKEWFETQECESDNKDEGKERRNDIQRILRVVQSAGV